MILFACMILNTGFTQSLDPKTQQTDPGLQLSFEATPLMQHYLEEHQLYDSESAIHVRVNRLLDTIFGEDRLGFSNEPFVTLAPEQALIERRGNCITFAMLIVALTREMGLDAHFNQVAIPPRWRQNGDVIVETGHVNVVIVHAGKNYVIEWLDYYRDYGNQLIEIIDDSRVRSHYYSNLSIGAFRNQNMREAFRWANLALQNDESNANAWQNLAVYNIRQNELEKAEAILLDAIENGIKQPSLYFTLSRLSEMLEKTDDAKRYLKIGEKHAKKNPFYHYRIARKSHEEGDYKRAIRAYKKSIRRLPNYHLFYKEIAKSYLLSGDQKNWRISIEKAHKLAKNPETRQIYERKLALPIARISLRTKDQPSSIFEEMLWR